jgi:hypothetical protein
VLYLLTRRQNLLTIPSEINASTRLPNPEYAALMARIEQGLREGGVVAYLRNYGKRRAFYPTEKDLMRRLPLHPRLELSDGAVYDAADAATTSAAGAEPATSQTAPPAD